MRRFVLFLMAAFFVSDFPQQPSTSPVVLFDEAQALDALGGDTELLQIVGRAFADEGLKLLGRVRQAIEQKNADDLRSSAHALKGSVRFFGETPVYDLASSLETQGRSGNLDRASEALQPLNVFVPQLIAQLQQVLAKAAPISPN